MRKSGKWFVTLLLMVMLASFGLAEQVAAEKILRIGLSKEPANLNPILIADIYSETVAGNLFDTLISFKENASEAAPLLAEKWDIAEDGKTYTFYLKKGVKFHNGTDLKAVDVIYTINEIMNPKNASPSKEFFKPVEKVEKTDDYTVRFTLKNAYSPFLLALASPTAGIVPAAHVAEIGMDAFDRAPIGTGAFKFVEWVPDDRLVLEKNKDYFLAEPNLDKLVFRPIPKPEVMAAELLSGGIDMGSELLPQDIDRLSQNENLTVKSVPGLSFDYIGFSFKTAPFSDVRFRKAVYHAMPFGDAIPAIYRNMGSRTYSCIPKGVIPLDDEYMKQKALEYDEAKAKQLFDALRSEGVLESGQEIKIYTPQNPQRIKIATVMSTQLRKYDIASKVETLEWGTLLPLLKEGKAGLYVMGWGSVPDPDRWTYKLFMPESSMNFSHYENPEVSEALEKGRVVVNTAKRARWYKIAMRQALTEDYIHIPLVFKNTTNVLSKKVTGFDSSPQKYIHLVTERRNVDIQ